MTPTTLRPVTAAELIDWAGRADRSAPCAACATLQHPGWEAMPASLDRAALVEVASLRDPAVDEPTLDEHHPDGTHSWSPDAPIALAFWPYNRCTLWQCQHCQRAYLRYTEYGGYYEEERVRAVDPALVWPDVV